MIQRHGVWLSGLGLLAYARKVACLNPEAGKLTPPFGCRLATAKFRKFPDGLVGSRGAVVAK